MKFFKGLFIVCCFIAVYRWLGLDWVLDLITDPASSVPSIEIGK